jgi:hypothetical protein
MKDFDACFDQFTASAFRLETLAHYGTLEADPRFTAFRERAALPDRSVRTSPWLRRMATTTAAGKRWSRVHVMGNPLSEYERFELVAYVESAAAGEQIGISDRTDHPQLVGLGRDFWLFDAGTSEAFAALLRYDDDGVYLDAEVTRDAGVIRACEADRDLALRYSVPLNEYLAARAARQVAAA